MDFKKGMVVNVAHNGAVVKIKDQIYRCLIRGNLKFNSNKILVGDYVDVNFENPAYPLIETILPRKNMLYRPKIANVDQVLIFNSLVNPPFSSFLLNKLLTVYHFYDLKIILVFTKIDLITNEHEVWLKIKAYQALNLKSIFISNVTKSGFNELLEILPKQLSLLTGTSGVGKSSTLNSLDANLKLWTQTISPSLKRGKHTTTSTNLYFLVDGIIADTPGFAVFHLEGLKTIDIANHFPSFANIWQKCHFRTCLHQQEPNCAIKIAVQNQTIPVFFYQDYCKILAEFNKINQN